MSYGLRRRPPRSLLRSLTDGLVFLALLGMAVLALRQSGALAPVSGSFAAVDGDSLRRGADNYRLNGIDAPELHQTCQDAQGRSYSCGLSAKEALRDLIAGETLRCASIDIDRYGRNVVACLAGTRDINAAMVRMGWAIAYRQHSVAYLAEEDEARRASRGIWQGRFENPQQWRARHRDGLAKGSMTGVAEPDD